MRSLSTGMKKVAKTQQNLAQMIDKNAFIWYNVSNGYYLVRILPNEEIHTAKRNMQL